MIFATVGTQLPFPRLVNALDAIAERHDLKIFVQTADPHCAAQHLAHVPHLTPDEFERRASTATLLIGHAGIGTVLTAKKFSKPLIVYPRRFAFGEHRNDHQVATARTLDETVGIYVAWDDVALQELVTKGSLSGPFAESSPSRAALVTRLKAFIEAVA
jgi:Uncharacterized conserved protein